MSIISKGIWLPAHGLRRPERKKRAMKVCWKAFITFENSAWHTTTSSRPFPPILQEPAVVRRIDCYTNHTTKSDHCGCSYASQNNLTEALESCIFLVFAKKLGPHTRCKWLIEGIKHLTESPLKSGSTTTDNSSWKCKPDKRESHSKEFNPVCSMKFRGPEYRWVRF